MNNQEPLEIKYAFKNCKVCGGEISTLTTKTTDGLDLAKCRNCGLKFVKNIPVSKLWAEDFPDRAELHYNQVYSGQPPAKFEYGLKQIIYFLKKENSKIDLSTKSLLDIGCGSGQFLILCQEAGFQVVGLEESESAIELCHKRGLSEVSRSNLIELDKSFDVITLFDVAEHLEEPLDFFKKINQKLNPGGVTYIEVPRKSILDLYLDFLGLFTSIKNNRISREHLQLYSDQSLRLLFEKSGFEIVNFETKQSLSWADKKQYIFNLGVKSNFIATLLEKVANVAIRLKVLGHNKAIVLARKV